MKEDNKPLESDETYDGGVASEKQESASTALAGGENSPAESIPQGSPAVGEVTPTDTDTKSGVQQENAASATTQKSESQHSGGEKEKKRESARPPTRPMFLLVLGTLVVVGVIAVVGIVRMPPYVEPSPEQQQEQSKGSISNISIVKPDVKTADNGAHSIAPVAHNGDRESAFIFTSDTGGGGDKKGVDLYISFDGAKGLNSLLRNHAALGGAISSGEISLAVHPVVTDNPVSVMMIEALGLALKENPEQAWEFLAYLTATGLSNSGHGFKVDSVRATIAKDAASLGYKTITEEALKGSTFREWVMQHQEEVFAKTGGQIPYFFVNNAPIDPRVANYNNSNQLFAAIRGQEIPTETPAISNNAGSESNAGKPGTEKKSAGELNNQEAKSR